MAAQYDEVGFTARTGGAGWFEHDQCDLLCSWPDPLSAPAKLMPITQVSGAYSTKDRPRRAGWEDVPSRSAVNDPQRLDTGCSGDLQSSQT